MQRDPFTLVLRQQSWNLHKGKNVVKLRFPMKNQRLCKAEEVWQGYRTDSSLHRRESAPSVYSVIELSWHLLMVQQEMQNLNILSLNMDECIFWRCEQVFTAKNTRLFMQCHRRVHSFPKRNAVSLFWVSCAFGLGALNMHIDRRFISLQIPL